MEQVGPAFNAAIHALHQAQKDLTEREENLHAEQEALQSERKRVEDEIELKWNEFRQKTAREESEALKSTEKVVLNVGGTVFETTKSTLMADPGSFFHGMVHSDYWKPDPTTGQFFIDRDPMWVREILAYLRQGTLDPNHFPYHLSRKRKRTTTEQQPHSLSQEGGAGNDEEDERDLQFLVEQADFFCIDSLLKEFRTPAVPPLVHLLSTHQQREITIQAWNGKYFCAEGGGGGDLIANQSAADTLCEKFFLIALGDGKVALHHKQGGNRGWFVCAEMNSSDRRLVVDRQMIGIWEEFKMEPIPHKQDKFSFKAVNGRYLSAKHGGGSRVRATATEVLDWEEFTVKEVQQAQP
eukprot:TRINITY_DN65448_c0_g1_i1.p1 TRINITY_DN65448_c0_g1~~TRINITY_DN65448_c0_g1_i1.p1  ORF type:complete len:353 (-),score=78.58 TRINITY_DN65448_c0_g1_i1:174-1232(-)